MKKAVFFTLTITGLLISSCGSNQSEFISPKEVFTVQETADLTKGDVLLIDVRNADEVAAQSYDVKNLINIPLDSIESELDRIPKDKQVILVCRSGKRSGTAFDLLKEKGYTNIATMEGGMLAWEEAGLPIIVDESVTKSACCADPTSSNCNPDGTCKTDSSEEKKACCSDPSSSNCNPDGTCKTDANGSSETSSK